MTSLLSPLEARLVDPQSTFVKRFGDLVAMLRTDPGNDAAQELALTAVAAAAARATIVVDAGVETSAIRDDLSLQGRLLARGVDTLRIAPGAEPHELLALARALAHDTTPLPSTPHIEVTMIPVVRPIEMASPEVTPFIADESERNRRQGNERRAADRRMSADRRRSSQARWPGPERRVGSDRRISGERRLHLVKDLRAEVVRLYNGLLRAVKAEAGEEVLHTTLGLVRLAPRVPRADRRTFAIQVRRAIQRPALEQLINLAERDPMVRAQAVEVLRWIGLDAAEAMLDRLREAPALGAGPRGFLLEALGGMPDAYPMVAPFLRSERAHEVRSGAILAGRLGRPEAADLLKPHIRHPDATIRTAAVQSLGELHQAPVADALRAALQHPDPATRSAAAAAIATWRGGALGVLLGAALETERDRDAWRAMIQALGRIGTQAACAALAAVALTRRSLLHPLGYSTEQRLAAVAALAQNPMSAGRTTLERLAAQADRDVRAAAERALQGELRMAG